MVITMLDILLMNPSVDEPNSSGLGPCGMGAAARLVLGLTAAQLWRL